MLTTYMNRVSLKIVGASGQGINSIGEIVAKGLKRAGYCVFGYREYPSLIKGGHASYQLDASPERIESTEVKVDVLITLNHHGLELNLPDLKQGGVVIHSVPQWKFPAAHQKLIEEKQLKVIQLPVDEILAKLKAKPILGNVIIAAFVWAACGQSKEQLKELVGERFAKKKDLLALNMQCIEEGFGYFEEISVSFENGGAGSEERIAGRDRGDVSEVREVSDGKNGCVLVKFPPPQAHWKDHLLVTGSHAMGLGAVHAGVRLYAGYPMTPSSPLLSYIADLQNKTGMVIKQAEDEITAAQMASGAMFMGTRALTGTSGGGFDLMSETVSMNAIIENPSVFVLAQRPGPATGLPTWTGQGDLLLAVFCAHGEFTRCVLSVSDSQDAFDLMPVAFNLAEEYQISVIVMTDKQIAEALYTQVPYNQNIAAVRRGIVTDANELKKLRGVDRYDPHTANGVSLRWLPGSEAGTYCAQGDEHGPDGTVDETAENAKLQMDKRLRKLEALKGALPEPVLYGEVSEVREGREDGDRQSDEVVPALDLLIVGWGSSKSVVLDVLQSEELSGKKIGYLHYTYLWPLRTEKFEALSAKAKRVVLVEGNATGQLGHMLRMQCGIEIADRILKYDGRPFFYDELLGLVAERCRSGKKKSAKSARSEKSEKSIQSSKKKIP